MFYMNNEIKVSVSITLQGDVLLTQAEAKQLEKNKAGTGYDLIRLEVSDAKGRHKEILNIKTRKTRDCHQSLNMGIEAYKYMISRDGCPSHVKQGIWVKMNPKQRLEAHLDMVCKALGGTSYTYKVFDD